MILFINNTLKKIEFQVLNAQFISELMSKIQSAFLCCKFVCLYYQYGESSRVNPSLPLCHNILTQNHQKVTRFSILTQPPNN